MTAQPPQEVDRLSRTLSRSASSTALCGNRTLAPKKAYCREKKLPMHLIASLEHDLKIPEQSEPINYLETKSTLFGTSQKMLASTPNMHSNLETDLTRKNSFSKLGSVSDRLELRESSSSSRLGIYDVDEEFVPDIPNTQAV